MGIICFFIIECAIGVKVEYKQLQQAQVADLNAILKKAKRGKALFKEYKAYRLEDLEKAIADEDSDTDKPATAAAPVPLQPLEPLYFYHPDHLGTSTALTDFNGNAYQFFLNLPFGETMAEQKSNNGSYETPYKFNGKELDEETGLYYYGARYYDPKVSIWYSVDPLAEKFPNHSPYVYCADNPVNMIDPKGLSEERVNDDYKLLKNGKLELLNKTDDKFDKIYNEDKSKSINVDKGFINDKNLRKNVSYFVTRNISQAKKAYKFFSNNTNVEFSLAIFHCGEDMGVISTTHNVDKITNTDFYLNWLSNPKMKLIYHSHSHPGEIDANAGNWPEYPSGFHSDLSINFKEGGDRNFYGLLHGKFKDRVPTYFNIYVPSAPNLDLNYNNFDVQRK